jgi:hypothetical protein
MAVHINQLLLWAGTAGKEMSREDQGKRGRIDSRKRKAPNCLWLVYTQIPEARSTS